MPNTDNLGELRDQLKKVIMPKLPATVYTNPSKPAIGDLVDTSFLEQLEALFAALLQTQVERAERKAELQGRLNEVHYCRKYMNLDANMLQNRGGEYLAKRSYELQDMLNALTTNQNGEAQ